MKRLLVLFLFIIFLFSNSLPFSLPALWAQTATTTDGMTSTQFDTSDFPLWAKDLRRGEIIAFGSFPFSYFFMNFSTDIYRFFVNGRDTRYAPWPLNSAGTIEKTKDEKLMTIGIAAGGAIVIALVDYGITRYKRKLREMESIPEGTPIIIRRPLGSSDEELVIEE